MFYFWGQKYIFFLKTSQFHFMLLIFIGIYLFITVLIGWYSSKFVKNSQDYVLAGRKMPTFVVASGLFATWFGSETVMGASSEFLSHGLLGVIEDPFGASLCLLLIGLFFARPLYKLKLYTFSDYFSLRFGKKVEVISAFFHDSLLFQLDCCPIDCFGHYFASHFWVTFCIGCNFMCINSFVLHFYRWYVVHFYHRHHTNHTYNWRFTLSKLLFL